MESAQRVQFLREYGAVRHAEGRGSDDPAYYLALPYRDLSGQNDQQWQIRGRSFRYLERIILPPLERRAERPLDILDLGAGNCWMSYRLALRKHRPVALDIFSDQRDGLGAVRHYPVPFPALEAQFDQLPFRPAAFDLAIFNASVHYSTDLHQTLRQSKECLRPGGRIIIVDSPVYARPEHGERMKAERLSVSKSCTASVPMRCTAANTLTGRCLISCRETRYPVARPPCLVRLALVGPAYKSPTAKPSAAFAVLDS